MAFETVPISGNPEKKPSLDLSDDDLVLWATKWKQEAEPFYAELERVWKKNEEYYLGSQTDKNLVPAFSSDAVQNHIFMGVETVVPIVTANSPQFVVSPANEDEISAQISDTIEDVLGKQYDERDIRSKIQQAVRHMLIYRFGVLKPYWDEYIDDVNVKVVHPRRLFFSRYGSGVEDLPAILEKIDMTWDEIKDLWGEEALKKVKETVEEKPQDRDDVSRTAQVWEISTNDFIFWKHGRHILHKQLNPYFDFEGRTVKETDTFGNDVEKDIFYNHFRRPLKPYIILSAFRLRNSVVGDSSLIEQTIPIQDIINVHLRSIINSAQRMGNPAWLIDSGVMSKEEAATQITNEPGLILVGTDAANPTKIRRDSPPPIPNYILNSKVAAEAAFDNIFGTHSTTRGERREPETLGGRLLLKQADLGRIDLLVREVERAVADLGNWFLQLMKLYYEKERTFKIYGEQGIKFVQFFRGLIGEGIQVIVKSGSTLPTDDATRYNQAVQLYQLGALDPVSLYERLKWPNPEETFLRLQQWQAGQLAQQIQAKQQTGTSPSVPTVNPLFNPQEAVNQSRENIAQRRI